MSRIDLRQVIRLVSLALVASLAAAQPSLTLIRDRIFRADGAPFSGSVMIEWQSFSTADQINVGSQSTTIPIVDGLLNVSLVPTTDAPGNAYYSVRYISDGKSQYREYWAVPPSASPLRLQDIRIPAPPRLAPSGTVQLPIRIADVASLDSLLAQRPVKSAPFDAGRVVYTSAAGALLTVSGALDHCVRVDGTSAPCGGPASDVQFVDNESPAGLINGSNASFQLSATPNPPSSLLLYRNGMLQRAGVDFDLLGSAITFRPGATPQPGDILAGFYRTSASFPAAGFVDGEIPAGLRNGANVEFLLSNAPSPASSLQVFRNGLLQRAGIDYVVNGNAITFSPASVPQPGDSLVTYYRR